MSAAPPPPIEEEKTDAYFKAILERVCFRRVKPTDIPACVAIEQASYPSPKAASTSNLQYRQHHAARYFRCAVLCDETDDEKEEIIGFMCATRIHELDAESMSAHYSNGQLLVIHSVVTEQKYRKRGLATALVKDYIETMREMKNDGVQKLVLIAKGHLLSFYVDCGFTVKRPSTIKHGTDTWYELQVDLSPYKSLGLRYFIVDAFAEVDKPGSGNPAAVVKLPPGTDPTHPDTCQWMQIVAMEFNLSETVFVWPHEEEKQLDGEFHYYIRYYTPTVEVALCGHATLASAGILYQTLPIKSNKTETPIVFHAKNDILRTDLAVGGKRSKKGLSATKIVMKFPAKPPKEIKEEEAQTTIKNMLVKAFGDISSDDLIFMGLSETGDLVIELKYKCFMSIGYDDVNFNALLQWDGYSRGVVLSCLGKPPSSSSSTTPTPTPIAEKTPSDTTTTTTKEVAENGTKKEEQQEQQQSEEAGAAPIDFYSRFFGPKAGINEDPVTGSAYCALGPYYCTKLEKEKVVSKQKSQRSGIVECSVDKEAEIVSISGTTVRVMDGSLFL